jgi:VanZ family protein
MTNLLGHANRMTTTSAHISRSRLILMTLIVGGLLAALHLYRPQELGLWTRMFFDSLHVPVFGVVAVSIYLLWPTSASPLKRLGLAFGLSCLLGALSEAAQITTARDASAKDFIADCLGAAGFLAAIVTLTTPSPIHGAQRWATGLLSVLLLGWALSPLAAISAAYVERNAQFPTLFSPETRLGHLLIRKQNIRHEELTKTSEERPAARLTFRQAPWPGIAFHDLQPDWSAYERLTVELHVEGTQPLDVGLRVHDRAHEKIKVFSDRFNRTYSLEPGDHLISIPMSEIASAPRGRTMDLTNISELIIFGQEKDAGRTIRLYSIRLE